jgi:hypothetical protein
MRPHAEGKALQIANQIEGFASRGRQLQRIPANPNDKVGLAAACGQKSLQNRHAGIVAIADADLARQWGATFKRLGAVLVGQFKMREAAAAKIEHAVDAPVRAFAAGFADTSAVSETQHAAGPAQIGAGDFRRQQASDQGGQECHRLLQSVMNAGIAEIGDLQKRHPSGCLAQRKAARATGQRQPQQARTVAYLAFSLDRFGLQRQTIEIEASRKPVQQVRELVRGSRCRGLHLLLESYHFEPSPALF